MQTHSAKRTAVSALPAFHHVHLNTGRITMSPPEQTMSGSIRTLLPIVRNGYGPVPKLPRWHLCFGDRMLTGRQAVPKFGMFTISEEPGLLACPSSVGMVCWDQERSQYFWEVACASYLQIEAQLRDIGAWSEPQPVAPPGPWLAVFVTDAVVPDAAANPKAFMRRLKEVVQFTPIERDIAWTLVAAEEQRV